MQMMQNVHSVKVVSDGSYLLDGGPFFGPVPKVLWEKQAKPDRKNRVRLGLNSLLIRSGDSNILVNTGIGSKEPEINRDIYYHQEFPTICQQFFQHVFNVLKLFFNMFSTFSCVVRPKIKVITY